MAACECPPCPGRGEDGVVPGGHCAECCFGTGVIGDIDCPDHGRRGAPGQPAWTQGSLVCWEPGWLYGLSGDRYTLAGLEVDATDLARIRDGIDRAIGQPLTTTPDTAKAGA